MQKMNLSINDIKLTLYHHFWEFIMFFFCWNSVPFLRRKKIFLYQNFFSFPSPHLFIFFFLSVIRQITGKPANKKQTDKTSINKIILYKFLFQIYIRVVPLVAFYSFWVRYNVYAPFTKTWFQEVVWDIEKFRIFCNFHYLFLSHIIF